MDAPTQECHRFNCLSMRHVCDAILSEWEFHFIVLARTKAWMEWWWCDTARLHLQITRFLHDASQTFQNPCLACVQIWLCAFGLYGYGTEPGTEELVLMFGVNTEPDDIHVWFKCSSDCSDPSKSRLRGRMVLHAISSLLAVEPLFTGLLPEERLSHG